MKRFFLLALGVSLLLLGCNSKSGVTEYSVFLDAPDPGVDFNETAFGKLMTEKTGKKLKIEYSVGDKKQKVGVMVASGDLPDMMDARETNQTVINAGLAVPLEDYVTKYGDNYKKNVSQDLYGQNYKKLYFDKHLYTVLNFGGLPKTLSQNPSTAFWVQADVLKEAGYPKITKLDEALALLKAYKDKYPKINGKATIAYTTPYKDREYMLALQPAWLTGHPNDGIWNVDKINGKWTVLSAWDTPEAKMIFQKYNDLYRSGYFDQEAFTISHDQFQEKLAAGNILGFMAEQWEIGQPQSILLKDAFEHAGDNSYRNRFYIPLPVTLDGRPAEYRYYEVGTGAGVVGMMITTKAKDPVGAFKYLDAGMSEEIQKRIGWGEKDKDYSVDEKGLFYYTDEQYRAWRALPSDNSKKNGSTTLGAIVGFSGGAWPDGNAAVSSSQPSVFFQGLSKTEQDILSKFNVKTWAELFPPPNKDRVYFPLWSAAPDKGTDEAIADNKLDTLRKEGIALLISAAPGQFEAVWNKYLADLKAIPNYDKLLQYRQNVVDTRMKEWQ